MSDLNMQTGSVVPKYDPQNPYAYPAFMPSSADSSRRSFHVDDFPVPTVKSEEWKYAPLEKMGSFFMPYDDYIFDEEGFVAEPAPELINRRSLWN